MNFLAPGVIDPLSAGTVLGILAVYPFVVKSVLPHLKSATIRHSYYTLAHLLVLCVPPIITVFQGEDPSLMWPRNIMDWAEQTIAQTPPQPIQVLVVQTKTAVCCALVSYDTQRMLEDRNVPMRQRVMQLVHHLMQYALLVCGWNNHMIAGACALIMLTEPSDVWLFLAKAAEAQGVQTPATVAFIFMVVQWFYDRMWQFYNIILSRIPANTPVYALIAVYTLAVLQVVWAADILRLLYNIATGQRAQAKKHTN
jgi:hypothetical protein